MKKIFTLNSIFAFTLFIFSFISGKSQMSSQNFSVLNGFEKETIQVLLEPEDCRKCADIRTKNFKIREAVKEFLTVANNVEYHFTTKEFNKENKKNKTEKIYLDYFVQSVEHKKGNYVYYTYIHYLNLIKRAYKTKYRKALNTKLLVAYRFGETPFSYDSDVLDMFPLGLKVMNAYLEDALEYKTLNPEIIANNNWRKCEINELQIFRGFLKKKELDEISSLESSFSIPINYIGYNEILQKVYTGEPSEKISIMAIPNLDRSSIKKSRGNYYYFIDLNTGKLYYKEDIKGLRLRFFGKKDMERITATAKKKYKAPRKESTTRKPTMKTKKLLIICICLLGTFFQAQSQFWRGGNQSYGDFLRNFYQDFRIDATAGMLTQPFGHAGIFSNTNYNYTLSLNYESNVLDDDKFGFTIGVDYQVIKASTPQQFYYTTAPNNDGNVVPYQYEFSGLLILRQALKIGGEIWLSEGLTFTPNVSIGYVDTYIPYEVRRLGELNSESYDNGSSYYDVGAGFDVRVALGLSVGLLFRYNYHYGLQYSFGFDELNAGGQDFGYYDVALGLYFRLFKNDYEK